ncbi:hypothetical protein QE152_g13463 [Popillia japonica]|uniref:Uncharacterized protein n=1 Tax=Popillia japonica TaxID=7064 RepID=A0AAW1LCM4_POPJA
MPEPLTAEALTHSRARIKSFDREVQGKDLFQVVNVFVIFADFYQHQRHWGPVSGATHADNAIWGEAPLPEVIVQIFLRYFDWNSSEDHIEEFLGRKLIGVVWNRVV